MSCSVGNGLASASATNLSRSANASFFASVMMWSVSAVLCPIDAMSKPSMMFSIMSAMMPELFGGISQTS